ncbi:MAG: DEAD/DEAH box helicase [Candidatus Thermoplasmatota archaeon]
MKVTELPIDEEIVKILKEENISELYPPQAEALPSALEGKNIVVSAPTASGKSLVAYLSIIHQLRKKGGKALYVVPLKALAREKYEELKIFEKMGFKIGITTGDLDDSDPRLARYDIIVCTSEKADSLLRHKVSWTDKVRVLVVDEIHLIHDASRGPTLEVIISRFKALNPDTQIVALSATIQNATELSIWLDAELIKSDWRPVPLREGVYYRGSVRFDDGETVEIEGSEKKAVNRIVGHSMSNGGQVLVFVNTRRSTVSAARRVASVVEKNLDETEKKGLEELVESLERNISELTSVDKDLFSCLRRGVAFHHAGLSSVHRRFIENSFRDRLLKCIVATPTLAAGVNIPAQRVVIRDLWRYDPNFGMKPIPILEYKQQAGRAGRPQFDSFGEAIAVAKKSKSSDKIFDEYVLADTEPIYSKLGSPSALRMHLLSSIATGFVEDKEGVYRFVDSTFYSYQADTFALRDDIDEVLDFLVENEFIEKINDDRFMATLFGKRTSSLYIDPLSGLVLKKALEKSQNKACDVVGYLHSVCSTPDVYSLYLRKSDFWVEEKVEDFEKGLLVDVPLPSEEDYEYFLSDLKTALLVEDWINEVHEDRIVNKYNVGPGDIHNIVETVEWLLHAMQEFARMYNFECVKEIEDLLLRARYGCKKELLNLVSLKGIGRVRARSLYKNGFKTVNDLRGVPVKRLAEVKNIGEGVANRIKEQIGEKVKNNRDLSEF